MMAMSTRPVPFAPDEWFHCFGRGVDKRDVYLDENDALRFQLLLYTANSTRSIHVSDFAGLRERPDTERVFARDREELIVDIGAYCLMPNHWHVLVRERDYGGISAFMQKLGTGYTMYFNKKHERTGSLFSGPFKAIHIGNDAHFRRAVNYIHANAAELYEAKWKEGVVRSEVRLKKLLISYPFSSLSDYERVRRPENAIVSMGALAAMLDSPPSFASLLKDARDFYRSNKDLLGENGKARP